MTRYLSYLAAMVCSASILIAQSPAPSPQIPALPAPPPLPQFTPLPLEPAVPLPGTPSLPAPTPLPDGTMPLPLPAMPAAPALPDAQQINNELAPPLPPQQPEPLAPSPETSTLQESGRQAVTKEMATTNFYKALDELIAKQRNPNVPDLTIHEAIISAIRNNPEILGAAQELNSTSGRFISIRSQIIPQVAIKSDYGYTSRELNFVDDLGAQNVNDEQWGVNIQFSQLIYDGGAAVSGIRAAISDEVESYYRLRGVIDQVISDVKTNFYEVVLNRALIIANQQSVDLLSEQLKDQQNRYEAGTVPRFNVLQAEVALANAKPPLIQAENSYRISMFRLVRLLGMDYPAGYPSEVPFNIVGKLDYNPRDFNADESIRSAVARNPELKAQRQLILGEAARVDKEFSTYLPQINARATQTNQSDMLTSSLTNMVNGWFFGVSGSWAVWDGFLTYGNVKTAKARMEQAKINYDNGVREVILQVQQAISNILEAKETVDSQEASVVQGVEALRLAQERLDAGAGTQLDVLNQQTSLLQSQTFLLQAYFSYIRSVAEYDRALSLDTKFQDIFDDPLTKPQAKRFNKINNPERPQPKLPRAYRKNDPIVPILEPAPSPSPTPAKKIKAAKNN
ncbi:MAG: outer membrane protein TolC precursor [Verrucomicrobiota bacterium]